MPELPEVQAVVDQLSERLTGKAITQGHLVAFSVLKTYDPPLDALLGLEVAGVVRHGKFIDVDAQGLHLVFHLARAGWVTWHDELPAKVPRPGKSGLALRIGVEDGSGFSLTEAGTQRHLAVYVVTDPTDVPGIAALGPDPLAETFTVDDLAAILKKAGKAQLKGVLRDQKVLAGIGNAYSDEILHAARLSPFKPASSLDADGVAALHGHIREVLGQALEETRGVPISKLKDSKRRGMRVHGRTGEKCEDCGSVIAEVSFADSSLQYCPGCQTGGKPLADRRLSKLLK
ncbi:Fpg/Nei family DNA glycosylase [Tessaracoccus sp. OS52]|uniref:Fpg/Nei family DNA glycosylase n=1 Tax=Tessaracoccus sp. OS52 TaxID=2886691 RepID=UPI001D10AF89|nr:DNA-formamidopyrimidine glycosylase family protein [Tessaracoccus sp. OS52]MCC2594069.1 Fpg/Nei family DNA glycosylase [Tessaracoccus sp. OS52]